MNIVLCGMMGSGKTTVARALGDVYGFSVIDTDEIIVRRHGEINAIFRDLGEERFRDIESQVVEEVASLDGYVISLGGGVALRKSNVEALKKNGRIFYLRTRADTIISRVRGDSARPLLQGDLEERVHTILKNRSAIYEGAADEIVDTDDKTPAELADIIVGKMQQ